jgi:hypothetical protein
MSDPIQAGLASGFLILIVTIIGVIYNKIRNVVVPPREVLIIPKITTKQEIIKQIGHHPDESTIQGPIEILTFKSYGNYKIILRTTDSTNQQTTTHLIKIMAVTLVENKVEEIETN